MVKRSVRLLLRKLGVINGGDYTGGAFPGTARYWEQRYRDEGTSGLGSYGIPARVKARFINAYIERHGIKTVIDLGAGDGNQLRLLRVPNYVGLDVSATAIDRLRHRFAGDATKRFVLFDGAPINGDASLRGELGLSMDVIYHLIEDQVYEQYLENLFHCALRHVIIYSSNSETRPHFGAHVRHRAFGRLVEARFPEWRLEEVHRNPLGLLATSNFFVYRKAVS